MRPAAEGGNRHARSCRYHPLPRFASRVMPTREGTMRVQAILLAAMLLAAAGLPATPARTETVVRWGAAGAPVTFDPHSGYNQTTNTFAMLRQVYEALTLVGPNQDVQPLLAE